MGRLWLVRHGQASFMSDNYDQLSDLGHKQAAHLGAWCAERGMVFDAAYTGPRRRHHETASSFGRAYEAIARHAPAAVELGQLDEFGWDALVRHAHEELQHQNESVRRLYSAYTAAEGPQDRTRTFEQFFAHIAGMWVRNEIPAHVTESWEDFRARVAAAIGAMTAVPENGCNVIAFTSGGPVSVAAQHALGISNEKTFDLMGTLRNASVSEFLFSKNRLTMSGFNWALPLEESLWTYR